MWRGAERSPAGGAGAGVGGSRRGFKAKEGERRSRSERGGGRRRFVTQVTGTSRPYHSRVVGGSRGGAPAAKGPRLARPPFSQSGTAGLPPAKVESGARRC